MPFVIQFNATTIGININNNGLNIIELGKDIFSGYRAANVLGVTSANISNMIVSATPAIATPRSPNILTHICAAIIDANTLTKLLPIRISPISRSGRCSSF